MIAIYSQTPWRLNRCSLQAYSRLYCSTKPTKKVGRKDESQSHHYDHLDALKASSSWTKSSFNEFVEKTFIHRFEYLVEKTSYMEEMRKSKTRMLEIQRKMHANGERRRSIIKQLIGIESDLNNIYGEIKNDELKDSRNDWALKKIVELGELEQQLWNIYNEVDQEELSLSSASFLAINESYEAEKMHSKFMNVISVVGALICSLLTLILSFLIRIEHQRPQSTIRHYMENAAQNFTADTKKESWGEYLHRNTRWMYTWIDRFR